MTCDDAADTQTRRVPGTLILSGEFTGDTMPALADWDGATATITVINDTTGDLLVGAADVAIDLSGAAPRYEYAGDALADGDEGEYRYLILVTFSGGRVEPFPSDSTQYLLRVLARNA